MPQETTDRNRIATMTDFIIQASGVTKTVTASEQTLNILHSISFEVAAGESVAISGPSGSGKSTLLALLAGLDRPSGGSITVDGHDLQGMDEDQLARLRAGRIGFVFQNFQLMPHLSALENVLVPLELAGEASSKEAERTAMDALRQVNLEPRLHHKANQLSGGEQQRVAIARAYVGEPRIVFADEPTSNLDRGSSKQISDLLFTLCKRHGSTLIVVTHDPRLAERCDRRLTLTEGTIEQEASEAMAS